MLRDFVDCFPEFRVCFDVVGFRVQGVSGGCHLRLERAPGAKGCRWFCMRKKTLHPKPLSGLGVSRFPVQVIGFSGGWQRVS